VLTQVRIGFNWHTAGCAKYSSLVDEEYHQNLILERLSQYLAIAIGGGFAIACFIAVCAKR